MLSDRTQILVAMGAYMALTIGVGFWYSKRSSRNAEAYFLGGRGLGPRASLGTLVALLPLARSFPHPPEACRLGGLR